MTNARSPDIKVQRLSDYISANNNPLHHSSPFVIAEALEALGLQLVPLPANEECGLCGREWGESHREGCYAIEIDGEYVS
jgi:hypothetical protein